MKAALISALVASLAVAVHGGKYPTLTVQSCTASGCRDEAATVVLDYRWKAQPSEYAANGILLSGNTMKLQLKGGNGPRCYLGDGDNSYKMVKLVGKEISYDVETSQLDCNMNGALYTVQMPASGASDGTGYCDANGVGGSYCEEFDIWEANKYATVMTEHANAHDGGGCGINPYAKGFKNLYGAGANFDVDTTKQFTVVTQFKTDASGAVNEIKRLYKQNGKVVDGGTLTSPCNVAGMGRAIQSGTVLAFSIWSSTSMQWLDAGSNGPCPIGSISQDATITFSNIRIGDIGTTVATGGNSTTTPTPSSTTATPKPTVTQTQGPSTTATPGVGVGKWGQCGGINYTGVKQCVSGSTCVKLNDYYSQCQ